jgi:hypothetical protein
MKIITATYGGVDVKGIVESKIKGDALVLRSSNSLFGDTSVGNVKYLQIEAELDGKIYTESVKEGNLLQIPKTTNTKLGIFYSNNTNPTIYPAIRASLKSIQKAAEGKADIMTCMWRSEAENPFMELIAWTNTQSHLNQLLQIMQLLYSAREINQYEYVSFLEHDVLYGEGYFDYPHFNDGEVLTNMNYMGICKDGFQPLGQRDEPFHQMTMKFEDAILHCEDILSNALVTNSGMIEPQTLDRKQWESTNSSIHINHGHHFTSHYNVYRKDAMYSEHPYWGNHNDYLYLFNT